MNNKLNTPNVPLSDSNIVRCYTNLIMKELSTDGRLG